MDADYRWDQRSDSDNANQGTDGNPAINTPEQKAESKGIDEEYAENQETDQIQEGDQNQEAGTAGPSVPRTGAHAMSAANADIPAAPHSAAAAVGAPTAMNTVTTGFNSFRSLAEFVGTKATINLMNSHASTEEDVLLRRQWLP